jgi:hypothetical protein
VCGWHLSGGEEERGKGQCWSTRWRWQGTGRRSTAVATRCQGAANAGLMYTCVPPRPCCCYCTVAGASHPQGAALASGHSGASWHGTDRVRRHPRTVSVCPARTACSFCCVLGCAAPAPALNFSVLPPGRQPSHRSPPPLVHRPQLHSHRPFAARPQVLRPASHFRPQRPAQRLKPLHLQWWARECLWY